MSNYGDQVTRGLISNKRNFGIFATSANVGTEMEDVWEGKTLDTPVPNMQYLDSPERLLIKSTDAADTFGGAGTTLIACEGVVEGYKRVLEIVPTNGITGALTQNAFLGVNDLCAVGNATLGESNYGTITAEGETSSRIQAIISIDPDTSTGKGQHQGSHYFVPFDEFATLSRISLTGEKNAEYKVIFDVTPLVSSGTVFSKVQSIPTIFFESAITINFENPPSIPQGSRIVMRAISDQGSENSLSGSYDLRLTKLGTF